jgi:hypothetical protein
MDPSTEKAVEPISIITVLDRNIQYFSSKIAAIDDKIVKADSRSRENLKKQLEIDKLEPQQLLKLNQSFKQQWLDSLNESLQKQQWLLDDNAEEAERFRRQIVPQANSVSSSSHPIVDNLRAIQKKTFETLEHINATNKRTEELLDQALEDTNTIQTHEKLKSHTNNHARGIFIIFILLGFCTYKYWYAH